MALADTLKTDLNAPLRPSQQFEKETIAPLREKMMTSLESEASVGRQKEMQQASSAANLSASMATYDTQAAKKLHNDPNLMKYQEAIDQKSKAAYIPDQENPERLATVLAITNLLGIAIGGKGKNSAQTALAAQNGMLEGYQKGRADIIKQQKDVFDENQKALDKSIENLHRGFQDALALAPRDRQAAEQKAMSTINQENADFLRELYNKTGLVGASKTVAELLKQAESRQKLMQQEEMKMIRTPHELEMERQGRERLRQGERGLNIKDQEEQRKIRESNDQSSEDAAQAIAKYTQAPPGLRDKNRNQILARAREINPDYSEGIYKDRDVAYKQFITPNGVGAKQIVAFNTVADHLNSIEELSKGLQNGDNQVINRVSNYLETQFGVPNVTNFNAAKQFVSGEVVKAITGTAGALKDREEAQRVLDAAQSPVQLQGAINTTRKLIAGRTKALQREYEQGTGRTDFENLLTPSLRTGRESSPNKSESTKVMPSQEKLQAYTNAHAEFGGDIKKAEQYLYGLGYR